MKKCLIALMFIVVSNLTNAQSFDAVSISGPINSAIMKYRQKGYVFVKAESNVVQMKGTVAGNAVKLLLVSTPNTKLFAKAVVQLPKQDSWLSLRMMHDKFTSLMEEKLGEPTDSYEFFVSPYERGDGFELSAVSLEKCIYSKFWFGKNNLNLAVVINKGKFVEISYENNELMEKVKEELDRITLNSF
jgi:hypothetical protein